MNIAITARSYEASEDLKKYVTKKVDRLQRYVPRHARKTCHAEVNLEEHKKRNNPYTCEILLHLPGVTLVAEEATINMFAAVDIVEAKLKNQLHKYRKKTDNNHQESKRFWSRVKNRGRK